MDARAAVEAPAGRGRVVRELLTALAAGDDPHRYRLYLRERWEGALDERFSQQPIRLPDPLWHVAAARRAGACDVFLSTNSYLTAWLLRVPCAVIVYDLVPFRPGTRPQRRAALIERATIRPAIRRAKRLVCISAATERDLVERFPAARGKTAVVRLAAGERFASAASPEQVRTAARRHGVDGEYLLTTGTLEPRKNLRRLIEAHASLPRDLARAFPLLVVGPSGWEEDEILSAVAQRDGAVVLAGHVPDEELAALYAGAAAFCYPSLYEGFGLPVLEAMQAGAPTITSNVSSLPEVAGGAALLVDPFEVGSIRDALERVLGSPELRGELADRGRRRAAAFSWDRTAQAMLVELERAAQAARTRS